MNLIYLGEEVVEATNGEVGAFIDQDTGINYGWGNVQNALMQGTPMSVIPANEVQQTAVAAFIAQFKQNPLDHLHTAPQFLM